MPRLHVQNEYHLNCWSDFAYIEECSTERRKVPQTSIDFELFAIGLEIGDSEWRASLHHEMGNDNAPQCKGAKSQAKSGQAFPITLL